PLSPAWPSTTSTPSLHAALPICRRKLGRQRGIIRLRAPDLLETGHHRLEHLAHPFPQGVQEGTPIHDEHDEAQQRKEAQRNEDPSDRNRRHLPALPSCFRARQYIVRLPGITRSCDTA